MRSKAPLALIEQVIMLLVFALSAALCLWAFVWADTSSQNSVARDHALIHAQSMAETLKSTDGDFAAAAELCGGTWENGIWTIHYDKNWVQVSAQGSYVLSASPAESGLPYLDCAAIKAFHNEICLVEMDVAWQEVENHA